MRRPTATITMRWPTQRRVNRSANVACRIRATDRGASRRAVRTRSGSGTAAAQPRDRSQCLWLLNCRTIGDVMADFTPTQGRYLAFIHAYTSLHGYPPAESEIAAAMCVSPPSVNQMVKMLEKKGLIQRQPGQPRSLQVLVPEDQIPPWNKRKPARSS